MNPIDIILLLKDNVLLNCMHFFFLFLNSNIEKNRLKPCDYFLDVLLDC